MIQRIVIFGDDSGIPQLLNHLDRKIVVGIVGAETRPHQHNFLKKLSLECDIPLLIQPKRTDCKYASFIEATKNLKPELFLVNSYSMLLSKELLDISTYGGVNIHCALLPEYRGANPTQWALINGETKTGVTIHKMTPQLDNGDLIERVEEPIHFNDTWQTINSRLYSIVDQVLARRLSSILEGDLSGVPQNESLSKHYHRRRPEDGRIDWKKPVISIYNLIRALVSPLPGVFYTSHDGEKIYIKKYLSLQEVVALKYSSEVGGKILSNDGISLIPSPNVENYDKFITSPTFPAAAFYKIRFNLFKDIDTAIPLTELTICVIEIFREARITFNSSIDNCLKLKAIRLVGEFCLTELHTPLSNR